MDSQYSIISSTAGTRLPQPNGKRNQRRSWPLIMRTTLSPTRETKRLSPLPQRYIAPNEASALREFSQQTSGRIHSLSLLSMGLKVSIKKSPVEL